jgi:catechol 2,3-dioxygenase
MSIDPATRIGAVHLTIQNLDRSVRFYQSHLGFIVREREGRTARLGVPDTTLIVLTERPAAPRVRGTTGLYHFAVLVPSRGDLGAALRRLVGTSTAMQGAADHGVSEALYLADPDGNGIEIYRDRPREEWPIAGGRLQMGVDPLDLQALLDDATGATGATGAPGAAENMLPAGTTMGHVHLHVADLAEADDFYIGVIGFDLMQRFGHAASFVSAGGYHHHLGMNTWAGMGAPPPPAGAIGLDHYVVRVPDAAAWQAVRGRLEEAEVPFDERDDGLLVRDPSQNGLLLSFAL